MMPGRRAGSGVGKYSADIPKQGQQKVQLYCKDDPLGPSRIVILIICVTWDPLRPYRPLAHLRPYDYRPVDVNIIVSAQLFK